MSTVVRDLQHARSAFERPTLRLLNQPQAPFVLAIFSSLLPAEQRGIPAELCHVKVDAALELLRVADPTAPDAPARELCRRWVKAQWLWRASNEDGEEEYGLTSHAQEALEYVTRLSGQRALLGESRIRTILDAAQRCATIANPDPVERIRRLEERIAEDTVELERLKAGGTIEPATTDQLMDEYLNLAGLLAALPSDFLRVSEAVKAIHRGIVAELRTEQRSAGEVLDSYLERADDLMGASLEGRAFRGAVELLRNERHLADLQEDLRAILAHEFAEVLTSAERTALRQTVSGLHRGIEGVLAERRRLSSSLARHIKRYDVVRDRELDEALTAIGTELSTWMATCGPRAKVPLDIGVPKVAVEHLRQRTYDPIEHEPPAALAQRPSVPVADLWALAREQGGPDVPGLRRELEMARELAELDGRTTLASDVFNAMGPEARRPVELLGLMHAAATSQDTFCLDTTRTETFRSRRPDGTERVFVGPVLLLHEKAQRDPEHAPSAEPCSPQEGS
jgi:hypothetical protein